MSTYSMKLKDPRWQKRRLEVFNRDDWTCQECGSKTKTLNVHHKSYIYGLEPWEYEDDYLVTVCEVCHSMLSLKDELPEIEKFCSDCLYDTVHSGTKYDLRTINDKHRIIFNYGHRLIEIYHRHNHSFNTKLMAKIGMRMIKDLLSIEIKKVVI